MKHPLQAADDARTVEFFTGLLQAHGSGPRVLNWGSAAAQERRFEVLAAVGDLAGASVLDVGCGLGDFYGWQRRRGLAVNYVGVDLTPGLVDAARTRFPEAEFRVADVFTDDGAEFDFVIASGIFYLRQHEPERFLEQAVARMFARCRRGVAFNSLSTWSARQDAGEFYADPLRTVDYCRTLTPRVVLRHDYHPGDFTVHLLKSASSS